MRTIITLVVDWEPSELVEVQTYINTPEELISYIESTVESNASFDGLVLKIPTIREIDRYLSCDKCGKDIYESFYYGKDSVNAGNCSNCGDNLCATCAVSWSEDGCCTACAGESFFLY